MLNYFCSTSLKYRDVPPIRLTDWLRFWPTQLIGWLCFSQRMSGDGRKESKVIDAKECNVTLMDETRSKRQIF